MRLANYLTESRTQITDYNHLIGLIKMNCKQYIKEVNRTSTNNRIFIREVSPPLKTHGYLQSLRGNRQPVDIKKTIHMIIDEWMYEKFKIRGRSNAWFVWSVANSTNKAYPDFTFAFPYDGYKYLFNPDVNDVYAKLRNHDYDPEGSAYNFIHQYGSGYTTKGALHKPNTYRVEVMLQAPKCLFVNSDAINAPYRYRYLFKRDFWNDVGITKFD